MTSLRRSVLQVVRKQKVVQSAVRRSSSSTEPILKSVFKDLQPLSNYTVYDYVWQNLDRWPDKTATVCAVTGHGYTYSQTYKMSVSFAASLRNKLKLQNEDKVAIILPNTPEYPCTLLGIMQAGCIASTMNPAYTSHELKKQLELIDCKAIVASKLSYPNISAALKEIKTKIPVILIDNDSLPEGTIKFAEFAEDFTQNTDCLKSVTRNGNDIAVLPFSSGTTGFPKGVALSHKSVVAADQMSGAPEVIAIKETTATQQSVLPAALPFFHIYGFNVILLSQMHFGCKLVTLPYFKPELFLQTIAGHKADVLFLVPPMVIFLGKHPAVSPKHLESITSIICGAAPIAESDAQAVISKNKNIIFRQGYGLTETNGAMAIGNSKDKNHASVGHLMPNCEVRITDLYNQKALGVGQEGEIWFRGPNLMTEYYKDEKSTKEVFAEDGWFKTGDIGKYDDKKYLYITDRLKELIKVKGFQVPPAELEALIRSHPKIADCAVVGIPDPVTGEVPKAFIVPQPGQSVLPDEIKEYVNDKVAAFKKLKDVQVIDLIPKNPAGKIMRKELKEKYC